MLMATARLAAATALAGAIALVVSLASPLEADGFVTYVPGSDSLTREWARANMDYRLTPPAGRLPLPATMQIAIMQNDQEWATHVTDITVSSDNTLTALNWLEWTAMPVGVGGSVTAAHVPCSTGEGCRISFNSAVSESWWSGVGETPPGFWDTIAVFTHEVGHWFGHVNCSAVPEYSPIPHGGATPPGQDPAPGQGGDTMCFDAGLDNAKYQRSPNQNDVQGVHYTTFKLGSSSHHRYFQANSQLALCGSPPGASTGNNQCPPTYWNVTGSYRWLTAHNGQVRMMATGTTELFQRAEGAVIDTNNDGKFRIRVHARSNSGQNESLSVFIRDLDGSPEWVKVVFVTPQWKTYIVDINLSGAGLSYDHYEWGVRTTSGEDVRVSKMYIRWKHTDSF